MIADLEYRVAELERLLMRLIAIGKVAEVDIAAARVKVAMGGLMTTWLPWLTPRAGGDREWWSPEKGEQVVVFSPCGDPALGVVLPAIYQTAFPAPASSADVHRVEYKDGAVTEYNRATHTLKATIPGDIEASCTGDAKVTADGKITAKAKNGIEHDGDASGNTLGTVNGFCLCPLTGTNHIQVSASVTSSK